MDVLGVGQCSLDEIALVDEAPAFGGKARMRERRRLPGGQIASALLGCARLGHSAAFLSSVADDAAATVVLAPLRRAGIDLARVRRIAGARTQSAWIWIDAARGERTVLWDRDERLALPEDAIAPSDVALARVVLLDAGDLALALRVATLGRELGVPCVLDADTPSRGIEKLLSTASHPVISESLARALYGTPEAAVCALARAGASLPVVTRGAAGAVAFHDGAPRASAAFAIEPVDTTGAGDAFHAGVAHALLCGVAGEELFRIAHAVAACACLALGAQAGLPDRARLAAFLAETPRRG
ncbi:MAG TPA: PfkB family carbohydrate kinase [Myxococcota bacterium]|nr:PfkB family carbohydrate kinase [Myxococcota bacterium]